MALYLDVETTFQGKLTVIGLHHVSTGTVQLVGEDITREKLEAVLPRASCVYTFNGDRFDLQIIRRQVGIDLAVRYRSVDLMKIAQRLKLYGGLKRVESVLGIKRGLTDISGKDAAMLWYTYQRDNAAADLEKLLAYNREDVENLALLRERLEARGGR